ncbi:MAG: NnrS family protein [Gammaproteobacteria bacterium]|nr:NnrS family protein [Gammaproteobacteria bacterium]
MVTASPHSEPGPGAPPGHPRLLLAVPFRPFFLLAAAWSALAMLLWLASLTGWLTLPQLTPAWHAHELLFGVVGAAAAGFALTAVATWTGKPPLAGAGLAALLLLWVAGRVTMLAESPVGVAAAVTNLLFLPALALYLLSRLVPVGQRRNYPLVVILLLLAVAHGAWHFMEFDRLLAYEAGLLAVAAMISLIAGRITPAFTRNWLRKRQQPESVREFAPLEWINVGGLLLASAAVLAQQPHVAAALALLAAIAASLRLAGWNSHRVLTEPLLWILHLAWLWLIAALLLMAASWFTSLVPPTLWWHALGAGAIGTILIGVMTRVALGHTGRPLELPRGSSLLYVLITVAAVARIAAALFPQGYIALLTVAATAWVLAWIGYLIRFGPILLAPRPDGRPG